MIEILPQADQHGVADARGGAEKQVPRVENALKDIEEFVAAVEVALDAECVVGYDEEGDEDTEPGHVGGVVVGVEVEASYEGKRQAYPQVEIGKHQSDCGTFRPTMYAVFHRFHNTNHDDSFFLQVTRSHGNYSQVSPEQIT